MIVKVIVLMICLIPSSYCHMPNSTTPTIADVVRVGASFVSRFLDSKSTAFLPSTIGRFFHRSKDSIPLLLRLLGVDSDRVQEWALKGFVSLLPLMNQVLVGEGEKRKGRTSPEGFSVFRFVLQRPQVAKLLTLMENPDLVDELLKATEERLEGADCVKLLLCKTTPIVRGMQKSLRFFMHLEEMRTCEAECLEMGERWRKAGLEDRMYFFLPSMSEMMTFGGECDDRYPGCGY